MQVLLQVPVYFHIRDKRSRNLATSRIFGPIDPYIRILDPTFFPIIREARFPHNLSRDSGTIADTSLRSLHPTRTQLMTRENKFYTDHDVSLPLINCTVCLFDYRSRILSNRYDSARGSLTVSVLRFVSLVSKILRSTNDKRAAGEG